MADLPTDPTIGTSLTLEDKNTLKVWAPQKYKEEFPDLLLEHLSKGLSFYSFDVIGGVATSTLIKWAKRYPDFAMAREIGEKARLLMLEEEGIKMIKGGNVVAWKFLMNQHGVIEKVDHNIQHNISHSPHMGVEPTIRYARLQKLKELHQRVVLESQSLPAKFDVEIEPEGADTYDAIFDEE
jgi:hypothetical protein